MGFEYDVEVDCEHCEGGQEEYDYGEPDRERGGLVTYFRKCRFCDGRGYYTRHMRPIDFEDLAELEDDADPYGAFPYRGGNP